MEKSFEKTLIDVFSFKASCARSKSRVEYTPIRDELADHRRWSEQDFLETEKVPLRLETEYHRVGAGNILRNNAPWLLEFQR